MQPDIDELAAEYHPSVDLVKIDVSTDLEAAKALGTWGTPTLIGVSAGRQVFRHTGRRTRRELENLFSSLASGDTPSRVTRADLTAKLLGGLALVGVGLSTGPVWALVGIGAGVLLWGLAPLLKWRG